MKQVDPSNDEARKVSAPRGKAPKSRQGRSPDLLFTGLLCWSQSEQPFRLKFATLSAQFLLSFHHCATQGIQYDRLLMCILYIPRRSNSSRCFSKLPLFCNQSNGLERFGHAPHASPLSGAIFCSKSSFQSGPPSKASPGQTPCPVRGCCVAAKPLGCRVAANLNETCASDHPSKASPCCNNERRHVFLHACELCRFGQFF